MLLVCKNVPHLCKTGAKISDFFEYMHILTENVRHKMWICVQKSWFIACLSGIIS